MADGYQPLVAPWLQGGGSQQANPLSIMQDAMKLRQGMGEWTARQDLGQIWSTSKDANEAMTRAMQNPNITMFPNLLGEGRQLQVLESQLQTQSLERGRITAETARTGLQMQGDVLTQSGTAREALTKVLGQVTDPSQLDALDKQFAQFSPYVQANVKPYLDTIKTSLSAGAPTDPDQRADWFSNKKAGLMIAGGMKPEEAYASIGKAYMPPTRQDVTSSTGAVTPTIVGGVLSPGGGGAAGQPSIQVPLGTGPTIAQRTGLEERTKQMVAYRGALDNAVSDGTTLMNTLQEGRDAMQTAATGGLSSARGGLAKLAQGLGVSSETVNKIQGGDIAATQEFQKLAPSMAMAQLRQQIPTGSRLNRQEWEAFEGANPNIDMDPNAINKIFNFWTRIHVRNRIEQQQLGDYVRKGGDLNDWPEVWQDRAQAMGLAGPVFKSPDGTEVTPKDIDTLLNNPRLEEGFDKHYGKGAAASFKNLRGIGR